MIQVLDRLPKSDHPDVLVGFETADDAGVYRIDDRRALVQTLDFFAPVVDDPFAFGAIAAANALSDVYAMGGTPLTAMAIACIPDRQMEMELLSQMMLGGVEKLREAGAALLGGHTVNDAEIKFGFSITGLVDPARILTNAGALPGDSLLLTKPLGIGIITTAIKRGRAGPETVRKAVDIMTALNRIPAEVMCSFRCRAATDITGYGLLGHACEMASASRVTLRLQSALIPFLEEAYALAEARIVPGLAAKTWQAVAPQVALPPFLPEPLQKILIDPQTSGGLLISVHPDDRDPMTESLKSRGVQASVIGCVEPAQRARIVIE